MCVIIGRFREERNGPEKAEQIQRPGGRTKLSLIVVLQRSKL